MDKLVRRVTVVQGGGENRHATIVYERDRDDDDDDNDDFESDARSFFRPLERVVRHVLKAEVIIAQEAYERHIKSAAHGRQQWLLDMPSNILNAERKGLREIRKAASEADHEDEGD
jgi:hypothetical protein